ncbi:hypothetical protein V2J09_017540 [Rumex salicifolius]
MAETPSSPTAIITELDDDSLALCTNYLNLRDITNMAMTCKFFKRVAYSDSVWHRLFSEKWPKQVMSGSSQSSTRREAYLARHAAVQQFKFADPLMSEFYADAKPFSHVLLQRNHIIFSQGSTIQTLMVDSLLRGEDSVVTLNDHNARITCMRLYSLNEASNLQSDTEKSESVLVTSSCDHSIRIWGKYSCHRRFWGHRCPVTTLSDKLLGDESSKVFASGGEDGTVRLWSLISSGKRQQNLKATLHGHERPVKLISVAWHKPSLLVTVAKDSKIRVWDSTALSTTRSPCCVGMTSVSGSPVSIKCYESLLYIASSNSVLAIDLRTMKKAFTAAECQPELRSFDLLPSKYLVCTGLDNRALLWDIRKSQKIQKPEPWAELGGHGGPVTHVHMDPYKIVTGGAYDFNARVWDTQTGARTNSLTCCSCYPERSNAFCGCACMAVDGARVVTASSCEVGLLRFRDFADASYSVPSYDDDDLASKFWHTNSSSDSEPED